MYYREKKTYIPSKIQEIIDKLLQISCILFSNPNNYKKKKKSPFTTINRQTYLSTDKHFLFYFITHFDKTKIKCDTFFFFLFVRLMATANVTVWTERKISKRQRVEYEN